MTVKTAEIGDAKGASLPDALEVVVTTDCVELKNADPELARQNAVFDRVARKHHESLSRLAK